MATDAVIVFKDIKSREIKTFVHLGGLGAEMSVQDFIHLVADLYGNPASTLTMKGHLAALQDAAEKAIYHMKAQTKEVAAINLEPV